MIYIYYIEVFTKTKVNLTPIGLETQNKILRNLYFNIFYFYQKTKKKKQVYSLRVILRHFLNGTHCTQIIMQSVWNAFVEHENIEYSSCQRPGNNDLTPSSLHASCNVLCDCCYCYCYCYAMLYGREDRSTNGHLNWLFFCSPLNRMQNYYSGTCILLFPLNIYRESARTNQRTNKIYTTHEHTTGT